MCVCILEEEKRKLKEGEEGRGGSRGKFYPTNEGLFCPQTSGTNSKAFNCPRTGSSSKGLNTVHELLVYAVTFSTPRTSGTNSRALTIVHKFLVQMVKFLRIESRIVEPKSHEASDPRVEPKKLWFRPRWSLDSI